MKIQIYLAHALTDASEAYRARMIALRNAIEAIPNVEVLRFAWIDGQGTDKTVENIYQHDIVRATNCHLFVAVTDVFSGGVGMELQTRCKMRRPLRVFFPKGQKLSRMITDCIEYHRLNADSSISHSELYRISLDTMPAPIEYTNDDEIVWEVSDWVRQHWHGRPSTRS
ncbi:MAG TPA: hypothetical protein VL335_02175 [Candidatus Paceibacterota bacterium]|jgi:hypothetical protein|nr:hypothetical protein [Candidatus Paceibacterota bacterium]